MGIAVLAVDPGLMTGWASYIVDRDDFRSGEVRNWGEWCHGLSRMFEDRNYDWNVVAEKYTVTSETVKKSRQYDALEIIGVLRYLCFVHRYPFSLQTPADAKSFATDKKLHMMGWHNRGHGHANDAARHLLTYSVRGRLIDPTRLVEDTVHHADL